MTEHQKIVDRLVIELNRNHRHLIGKDVRVVTRYRKTIGDSIRFDGKIYSLSLEKYSVPVEVGVELHPGRCIDFPQGTLIRRVLKTYLKTIIQHMKELNK